MIMKDSARILDATAGNRCLWSIRESPFVIWVDVEEELNTPPDRFLDCRKTDYPNDFFYGIIFDPPHSWGHTKNSSIFTTPSKRIADEKWPQHKRPNPRYYGLEKYENKSGFLRFIYDAQEEFFRILADSGMLWLKWSENRIKLNKILTLFKKWNVMIKIPVRKSGKTAKQTWWILLMKKSEFTNKVKSKVFAKRRTFETVIRDTEHYI